MWVLLIEDDKNAAPARKPEPVFTPLFTLTAFRCEAWNTHCKGHPNSYHLSGRAADVTSAIATNPNTNIGTISRSFGLRTAARSLAER